MRRDRQSRTTYTRAAALTPWAAIGIVAVILLPPLLLAGCEWLAVGAPLSSAEDAAIIGGPDDGDDGSVGSGDSGETYTITYDANGATSGNAPADQTKTPGVNLTLASNTGGLAKSGYNYAGWNTASDGSGTDYAEGATYTADADVTLYAKWTTLPTYTVTYHPNGADGGSVPPDQTKTQGVDLTLANNTGGLVKTNHTLTGWNTQSDGYGSHYDLGGTYTADVGDTLYAEWEFDPEKLLASDGAADDEFGRSVAISGDYAIVGANNSLGVGDSAYIFHRIGINTWDGGTKITASDGENGDFFGSSVAISGDYAIVGALGNDDDGFNSGSAYIFHRTGTNTWDGGTKLTASDGAANDNFGVSVAISGDYAVVGAPGDDDIGSAYVFHRTGTNTWDGGTKLTASDGAASDIFGESVGISGDHVIVGAPWDDDDGDASGSAYIFFRIDNNSWNTGTKITASDGATDDNFGRSVAISGDYAIVGAALDDNNGDASGSGYIFRQIDPTTWDTGTKVSAYDGAAHDQFGYSVSISGDSAIVGAWGDDDNGSESGSTYIFHRTGTNTWDGGTKIIAPDGAADDFFGYSVAVSGNDAIVGVTGDDDNGSRSGSAYVFITP